MSKTGDKLKAASIFHLLTKTMNAAGWTYKQNRKEKLITTEFNGDKHAISLGIKVYADRQMVQVLALLSPAMPKDKLFDGAVAACLVNEGLGFGNFDYDMSDGSFSFRDSVSYLSVFITKTALAAMILRDVALVDKYNDYFYKLANNKMTLVQFVEKIKQ